MKIRHTFFLLILLITANSCTLIFLPFIRNVTTEDAIIDVYLSEESRLRDLPTQIKAANKVVKFRFGYGFHFNTYQNITWLDSTHCRVIMKSKTTLNLSTLTGIKFLNGSPRGHATVIVKSINKIDTLLGSKSFWREKFKYKGKFSTPILYYDIE